MTSAPFAADDDRHPEVAEISAYAEDLLPVARSDSLRSHLSTCSLCGDVLLSLQEIRAALGDVSHPPRMPEDVASRIDAALAAEALLEASDVSRETLDASPSLSEGEDSTREEEGLRGSDAPSAGAAASTEDPASPTAGVPPQRRNGVTAAKARPRRLALVSRETHRRPTADRPPNRNRTPRGPASRRRSRRMATWGAAGVTVLAALGGLILHTFQDSSGETPPEATTRATAADHLGARVRTLLTEQQPPNASSARPGAGGEEATPFRAEEARNVPRCVRQGIARAETPLAVDTQTFQGTRSYIVVLPHASDPRRVDAYAVDASCTSGDNTTGAVLASGTYPRD